MKKIALYFAIPIIALSIFSCSSNDDDDRPTPTLPSNNGEVTYTNSVKSIIDGSCNNCHGNPVSNGAPISLTNLNEVKVAIQNKNLIGRIENGTMPPNGKLSAAQIQKIKDWKDKDYKN